MKEEQFSRKSCDSPQEAGSIFFESLKVQNSHFFNRCAMDDGKRWFRSAAKVAGACVLLAGLLAGCTTPVSSPAPQPAEPEMRSGNDFLPSQRQAIDAFIHEMASKHGFDESALQATFHQVKRSPTAIRLVTPSPRTQRKNWQAYKKRIVDAKRIKAGVAFWKAHEEELKKAEAQYGVPAEIIVSIIGVESFYGRTRGKFRVLDVLTTLAFDFPPHPRREARKAFFRDELEQALLFARESKIDPLKLKGSYAGAIGLPQFMPGSIRRFGVDYDADKKVDLGRSPEDAIGSVANFLANHGWKRGDAVVMPAIVESDDPAQLEKWTNRGLEATLDMAELQTGGVRPAESFQRVAAARKVGLIDLQNGDGPTEYWIATDNFFAITQYNRSYFYAMSVVELAKAIRRKGHPRLA